MIVVLHQHSHHHHHDHNNNQKPVPSQPSTEAGSLGAAESNTIPTTVKVKKHSNINVRAAFIHVIGDLFQSIGVVVAAYIIRFNVCEVLV